MDRVTAFLLCLIIATVTVPAAAPPPPKPIDAAGLWFDGWDKPIDPVGDCKFERKKDRLTIRVPGGDHELAFSDDRLSAPRLLREVEGDFVMQVRVGGAFRPTGKGIANNHRAGIILLFGKNGATLLRGSSQLSDGKLYNSLEGGFFKPAATRAEEFLDPKTPLGKTVYLRVERRGRIIELKTSPDGKRWTTKLRSSWIFFVLPRKLKVGVVAESTSDSVLQAEFDQFQLTSLGRPSDGKKP